MPWRKCRIRVPRMELVWGLMLLLATHVAAEDVVVVRAKEGRGTSRSVGEIVDWNGRQLTVRRVGNREESIEAGRVVDVQTAVTAAEKSANEEFTQQHYDAALKGFQAAYSEEKRAWVRRRILARSVWCLRNTDRMEQAIDLFLRLDREDPTSQYFDAAPLTWFTVPLSSALERKASALVAAQQTPLAKLIGASWLLPTSQRPTSLAVLQNLITADDPRVASWADAQLWRSQVVTVTADTASRWRDRLLRMPTEIQFGPAFVLGQAYSRLKQTEEASLLFLRAPILQPLDRQLAAQGLIAAARELEAMDRGADAARLYREILTEHATSAAAPIARERLAKIDQRRESP